MEIKMPRILFILLFLAPIQLTQSAYPADGARDVAALVDGFPSLDSLERRMGAESAPPPQPGKSVHDPGHPSSDYYLYGLPQPILGERVGTPSLASPFAASAGNGSAPMSALLSNFESSRQASVELADRINRKDLLAWNRYFFDRISASARTDYGNSITGVFVNGVGFGTSQQTFRQNYVGAYTLPLLQRYGTSAGWSRVFAGWTVSSIGAEPQLNQALSVPKLLNNLQLTWSVAFSYNLSGSTFRKLRDGQLSEEAALGKARERSSASRDELLRSLATRIEVLSSMPRRDDARLASLRQLYSQFELFQVRYRQARSCSGRIEEFYTLKGLALGLLTLADFDPQLVGDWKSARLAVCDAPTTADDRVDGTVGGQGSEEGLLTPQSTIRYNEQKRS
jgi:hypothetical protein